MIGCWPEELTTYYSRGTALVVDTDGQALGGKLMFGGRVGMFRQRNDHWVVQFMPPMGKVPLRVIVRVFLREMADGEKFVIGVPVDTKKLRVSEELDQKRGLIRLGFVRAIDRYGAECWVFPFWREHRLKKMPPSARALHAQLMELYGQERLKRDATKAGRKPQRTPYGRWHKPPPPTPF